MVAFSILTVLVFSTVLCIAEVPKMLKGKLYRELWAFSTLLALGTVLAMLQSLDVAIPNPSDFIAWINSPFVKIMKTILE